PVDQRLPAQIFGVAYGVLAAGVAQAAFQLPTLWHDGFRYRWVSPWGNPTVQRVIKQMIPGTIGIAAFQINVAIVQGIGLFVGTGIVSSFNGAVRLMEFPQGLFGISLATYLLPTLAGLATDKNYGEFRSTLRQGLGTLIFLNLIASVLLVTLAEPIVRLLFEHGGRFTALSTMRVSYALTALAPGLVMFSSVNILARAFYALGDTRTPMKISIVCLVVNLLLALILLPAYHEGGPGMANTVTSAINVGLLLFALHKKLGRLEMASLCRELLWLLPLTAMAGTIAWVGWHFWRDHYGHATVAQRIGEVFVPATVAGGFYWLIALAVRVPAAREISELILARFKR